MANVRRRTTASHEEQRPPADGRSLFLRGAKDGRAKLLTFDQMPDWLQDNAHIRHFYRPLTPSAGECFRSLFYLHNETMNIYTHLLPAIVTLALEFVSDQLLVARYPRISAADRLVFSFHLLAIMTCMGLSGTYHILTCHSHEIYHTWSKIDYCGIMVLIWGSFISGLYFGLYCERTMQYTYWTMITIFTTATAFVVLHPALQTRRHRILRLCSFTGTGLSAFAPIGHALSIFGAEQFAKQSGLHFYYGEGVAFLLAAVVYAARLPESLSPGRFDLFGASHQIFHVLVVIGAVVHVAGLKSAFEYNYYHERC